MSGDWIPPAAHVATLPKATVHGCFFVTDTVDHPIQLRAARNPSVWQWPGETDVQSSASAREV
ncbi:hypothetical protein ACFXPY_07355 [Streptomyces sp. NPDC059153]|uniref:hypothetical protein n=1 Tax=unclassified Streptomyces TaxID=2593676 RepID=UPI00368B6F98